VNKWFALQAMSDTPGNVENIKKLLNHPAFDIKNPNKVLVLNKIFFNFQICFLLANIIVYGPDLQVYSLIGGFCGSPVNFHAKDGSGYKFLGEIVVQLDQINPQVCMTCIIFQFFIHIS
jgi:aminopeptidase N